MADFILNGAGLREYLLSNDLYPALEVEAAKVLARAKGLAASHVKTGHYMASFGVERGRTASRVHVRVINNDEAAAAIEAQQHILGRAAG